VYRRDSASLWLWEIFKLKKAKVMYEELQESGCQFNDHSKYLVCAMARRSDWQIMRCWQLGIFLILVEPWQV